ncbi:MAG: NUDIX domain-containing protein [Rhodomicrobium sp.]|jgi:ADP-ribose pyrophosphatase
MTERTKPWRVEIVNPRRLLDAFFKVDEYTVSHERFDGAMSEPRPILVFERGDAVAALLYDPERRVVITVHQFRLPTREKGQGRGWLIEAVAGMIPTDESGKPVETPMQTLIREVREETGYQLTRATAVARFFSSPGGSTELIYLYYAEVRKVDKKAEGGGLATDGEDIEIVEYPIEDFFARLTRGEFEDPKLIVAGQWLMAQRGALRAEFDAEMSRTFAAKIGERQILGIKTGDIRATADVEVWVNSENTDMMMDRFFGRSVSATIRSLGARKHEDGKSIAEDTIGKALAAEMGPRSFVKPGTVLWTGAGELAKTHNVRQIFHVAAVAGSIGAGLSTSIATIETSIDNVLKAISAKRYRSALIPLLGTGQGGFPTGDVAPRLVERAHAFFKENPKSLLREVYFLAYSEGDLEILKKAIRDVAGVEPAEAQDPIA